MRTNCVPLRSASSKKPVGYAFDVVTAMINHSCDPNAFVYFEGNKLRVRSIKPLAVGEEITICYVDPTLILAARKAFLQREYFFDCSCKPSRHSDVSLVATNGSEQANVANPNLKSNYFCSEVPKSSRPSRDTSRTLFSSSALRSTPPNTPAFSTTTRTLRPLKQSYAQSP